MKALMFALSAAAMTSAPAYHALSTSVGSESVVVAQFMPGQISRQTLGPVLVADLQTETVNEQ